MLALTTPNLSEVLLSDILSRMEGYEGAVRTHCLLGQVPETLVDRLLCHQDPAIASAAAWGEWHAEPEGRVRDSLLGAWRDVVIKRATDDYWLAYEWLETRVAGPELSFYRYEKATSSAVQALDIKALRCILPKTPAEYGLEPLIRCLVDARPDLYGELLNSQHLRQFHLAPLSGQPDATWAERARLALDAGYDAKDLANAAFGTSWEWGGSESKYWKGWLESFDRLSALEDERIREVGDAGKAIVRPRCERALERERHEAVYGIR